MHAAGANDWARSGGGHCVVVMFAGHHGGVRVAIAEVWRNVDGATGVAQQLSGDLISFVFLHLELPTPRTETKVRTQREEARRPRSAGARWKLSWC